MKYPDVPISIIIPVSALVRKAVAKRLEALQFAIKDMYQGVEVIVVEQSLDGKVHFLANLPNTVKKIALEYPVFNKGWCINVGVKHASSDYIVVADADMYTRDVYWKSLYEWMKAAGRLWAFAWHRLIYTNDEQREAILIKKQNLCGLRHETPRSGYSEGGLVCFYKPFFYAIGQCNEHLQELGGIDNELIIRARHKHNHYDMFQQLVYHLWHQQIPKSKRPTRSQNIQMIGRVRRNTKSVIEWMQRQELGGDSPLISKKGFME